MIDIKSKLILKILAHESENGSYKIVEASDLVLSLPKHYRMDIEAVKHILTYLERQDMISIKYDDDNVYCLAVLPYGYEILESDKNKIKKDKKHSTLFFCLLSSLLSAFISATITILIIKFG